MVSRESAHVGLAVTGTQANGIAERLNYHEGWRGRPCSTIPVSARVDVNPIPARPFTREHNYAWWTEPESTLFWVAFQYVAYDHASAPTRILAELRRATTSVVFDAGCTWSYDEGDLMSRTLAANQEFVIEHWGEYTNTGFRFGDNIDPLIQTTRPRLFDLTAHPTFGTGVQNDVELHLNVDNVQLYTVSAWEIWRKDF